MDKNEEIKQADRLVRDSEIKLSTIKLSLTTLENEVDHLSMIESQLVENLSYLKRNKIVALAKEFKNIKEHLKTLRVKLIQLKNDREVHRRAYNQASDFLTASLINLDKIIKRNENNVVVGKFGKNNE